MQRPQTFDELADRVLMIEQEQASILEIQKQQLITLQRLSDLNTFVSEYPNLGSELRNHQIKLFQKCEQMNSKLDGVIGLINGEH